LVIARCPTALSGVLLQPLRLNIPAGGVSFNPHCLNLPLTMPPVLGSSKLQVLLFSCPHAPLTL
jgi:hypothetical protein